MINDVVLVIRQCLAGNNDAWNLFVKEFSSLAKNIINRAFELTSGEQDDVIQNIFLKLIRGGLANFNGSSKYEFLKYFKTIVLNETRSHFVLRKGESQTVYLNDQVGHGAEADELKSITIGDTIQESNRESAPEALMEERELVSQIMNILKDEPLLDKQVFLMKIEGYKDEEIKQILKIPIGTVASKFSRIKARLREGLEKE